VAAARERARQQRLLYGLAADQAVLVGGRENRQVLQAEQADFHRLMDPCTA
jgi:hypothetical protein